MQVTKKLNHNEILLDSIYKKGNNIYGSVNKSKCNHIIKL